MMFKITQITQICVYFLNNLDAKNKLKMRKFFFNRLSKGGGYTVPLYIFLLSSIYIRKYWIRENFRLPVFDGFTCFEMS